jgi:aryl-alcohol dehydrogenase-like predicted oxidoreductase
LIPSFHLEALVQYRTPPGWKVSTFRLGCWAIGGCRGSVEDRESLTALQCVIDLGAKFFDTADADGSG